MEPHQLLTIKGLGKVYYQRIVSAMAQDNLSLEMLCALEADEIKKRAQIPITIAQAIKDNFAVDLNLHSKIVAESKPKAKREKAKSIAEKNPIVLPSITVPLDEEHYRMIKSSDSDYPQKLKLILGDKTPEALYVWGNLDLLAKPSVGFCGSRDVSDRGLTITKDICEQISALDWVTVSGHARGVDIAAHRTALENNSGTIIVLPEGINGFKLRRELQKSARAENILIISEFMPSARWNVGYAMQRNSTIIGLSDAMVLVESRDEGGTFNAGKMALKLQHPLFVVKFLDVHKKNAGNDYFIQRGAHQLMKSPMTNKANVEALVEKVKYMQTHRVSKIAQDAPQQLTMPFDSE